MIHRQDAKRQAARKRIDSKPDESGYLAKNDAALKRERIAAIVAEIRASLPPWALLPPWDAQQFIEPQGGHETGAAR